MKIFQSASKIVLILITLATIAGMFLGKISGEQFMGISMMVFGFYYGTKPKTETEATI